MQHIKVAHNFAQMQISTWFNRALKEHLFTDCHTGVKIPQNVPVIVSQRDVGLVVSFLLLYM